MNTKAHVTFRGDAICGADLTGKSPDGLPSCQDCLGVLFDWIVAHDVDTAHAVALERAAIAKYLFDRACRIADNRQHMVLRDAASAIASGAHDGGSSNNRSTEADSLDAKKAVHDIIVWLDAEIESGERCKVNKQWPRRYRREQEIRAKSALDMRFMITALHGGAT